VAHHSPLDRFCWSTGPFGDENAIGALPILVQSGVIFADPNPGSHHVIYSHTAYTRIYHHYRCSTAFWSLILAGWLIYMCHMCTFPSGGIMCYIWVP